MVLQALDVLNDGGKREGYLVLANGALAAVLIAVTEEDTGGGAGWYVEAGFGPCSALRVLDPPVFPDLADVADWVHRQIEQAGG